MIGCVMGIFLLGCGASILFMFFSFPDQPAFGFVGIVLVLCGLVTLSYYQKTQKKLKQEIQEKREQAQREQAQLLRSIQLREAKEREQLIEMDKLSVLELSKRVVEIFQYGEGAEVKVEVGKKDRCILDIQTAKGERYIAIVKRTFDRVGLAEIRSLYGLMMNSHVDRGFFFTNETFTPQAIEWAKDKPIRLIDEKKLNQLADSRGIQWKKI